MTINLFFYYKFYIVFEVCLIYLHRRRELLSCVCMWECRWGASAASEQRTRALSPRAARAQMSRSLSQIQVSGGGGNGGGSGGAGGARDIDGSVLRRRTLLRFFSMVACERRGRRRERAGASGGGRRAAGGGHCATPAPPPPPLPRLIFFSIVACARNGVSARNRPAPRTGRLRPAPAPRSIFSAYFLTPALSRVAYRDISTALK